jgi:hypothetical protein
MTSVALITAVTLSPFLRFMSFGTVLGDDRLQQIVADFDGDESCDPSEKHFRDLALQIVPSAKRHKCILLDKD